MATARELTEEKEEDEGGGASSSSAAGRPTVWTYDNYYRKETGGMSYGGFRGWLKKLPDKTSHGGKYFKPRPGIPGSVGYPVCSITGQKVVRYIDRKLQVDFEVGEFDEEASKHRTAASRKAAKAKAASRGGGGGGSSGGGGGGAGVSSSSSEDDDAGDGGAIDEVPYFSGDDSGSGEDDDGNDGSASAAAKEGSKSPATAIAACDATQSPLAVFVAGKNMVPLEGGNFRGTCMVGTPIMPAPCDALLRPSLVTTAANALGVDLSNCTTPQQRSACVIGAIEAVRKKARSQRAGRRYQGSNYVDYHSERAEHGAYERLVFAVGVKKAKHVIAMMGAALCKISAGDFAQVARELRAVNRPGAMGCAGVNALTFLEFYREALVEADFAHVYEKFVGGESAGRYSKWLPCHLQRFLARAAVVGLVLPEKVLRALLILTGKRACVLLLLLLLLLLRTIAADQLAPTHPTHQRATLGTFSVSQWPHAAH